MRREELVGRLRAAAEPGRERAQRAWAEVRRHPDAVAVAVLLAGVVAMILHWG